MGQIRCPTIWYPPKIFLDEWLNAPNMGSCEPRVPKSIYLRVFYDICESQIVMLTLPVQWFLIVSRQGLTDFFKKPHWPHKNLLISKSLLSFPACYTGNFSFLTSDDTFVNCRVTVGGECMSLLDNTIRTRLIHETTTFISRLGRDFKQIVWNPYVIG